MNKVEIIGRLTKEVRAFEEKYLQKGMKIGVTGHLQSSSYEKDGENIYTIDVVVTEHEFCEKKNSDGGEATA